jgi:ATP-dependent DNA ligase
MARKDPGPRSMARFIGRVIKGSKPDKHPGFVEPQLATLRTKPPRDGKYVHEIKFDGYRVQAHKRGGLVSLWTRGGLNWTRRFEVIGYKRGATSLYVAKRAGKELLYLGKAGTGFTNSMTLELARLLKPITLAKSPLSKLPDRKNKIDHWVAPKYWAEVEYRDVTTDGLLRHTTFRGLYDSKTAKKPIVAKFK